MRLDTNCIPCNINQAIRISDMLKLDASTREAMMRELLTSLATVDYAKCNPEVMASTWDIIVRHTGNPDPYKEIKIRYNQELAALLPELTFMVEQSADPFETALKIAIAGNLVDFAAQHPFSLEQLKMQMIEIEQTPFGADHSAQLRARLAAAHTLLYLGDNCGEIVMDKLFIQVLKRMNPDIKAQFGVRGKAIVDDVTVEDAVQVGMSDVADILPNGDNSLGTVLPRTSHAFQAAYAKADVVIAKGQGNYESLSESGKPGVFHLFLAKCEPVARSLGIERLSIVCIENHGG